MSSFNIDTDRIYKYTEELKWKETKAWMEDAQNAFINGFNGVYFDYQQYKDFASLEEKIATQIFGVDNEFAERAYKGSNLLQYFGIKKRKKATRIREKMEQISGREDIIKMQVVPIAARMDEDLKRNESDTEEEKKKKEENKSTGRIYVFRVETPNGYYKFLDSHLRVYNTWNEYLSKNKLPQCLMCYPKNGMLIKKSGDKYVANDVEFGEPPSCKLYNQLKAKLDKVVVVVTPVIALASACCPATWAVAATCLSYTSLGLYCYSIGTQGLQIIDQIKYGEDYETSLMNVITSIGTMIVNKGLSAYLRKVDNIGRSLYTVESLVISGFLLGLAGSQVASWASMTWSIATKAKITSMDVVSYVLACHNLYSCIVSPKFASTLLERVRNEIQAEQMKDIKKNNAGNQAEIERLKRSIYIQQYIQQENKMKDERTNGEFITFTKDALEQRGDNTIIDQNGRIIKVMVYMDAVYMVFKMELKQTGSTVQFSNGEKLDLCFNSQFDVHPRAINQMNQIRQNNKTDLQNMMELTKQYTTGQVTDETAYLKNIKDCLKPYEMIMDDYRMEIDDAPQNVLPLAHRLAKAYNSDTSINTLAAWVEIVKHECHEFKMPDPVTETPQERIKYYREQGIPDEITGMMNNGMSEAEATDRANANFAKREAIEQARINGATPEELRHIAINNKVENDQLMHSYHQRNYQEWAAGGTKEELFFQQFNDQANFDAKMATYREEFEKIKEDAKKEALTFPNPVIAYSYYHVKKHGRDSATNTSTIYRDGRGYIGVTKCSYDADLERETGI